MLKLKNCLIVCLIILGVTVAKASIISHREYKNNKLKTEVINDLGFFMNFEMLDNDDLKIEDLTFDNLFLL